MTVLRRELHWDEVNGPVIEGDEAALRAAVATTFGQRPIRVVGERPWEDPFGYACFAFDSKSEAALFKLRHGGDMLIEGTA
jgi:hypothetical protein